MTLGTKRNEAARRLGIPVCEACSEPDFERRRVPNAEYVELCDRCWVDWLRCEVAREMREKEGVPF